MHVPRAERFARRRDVAQRDRDLASEIIERYSDLSCYHSQQVAEKALKALITAVQGDSVATHSGRVLLSALKDMGVEVPFDVRSAMLALDAYYIPTRYPDANDFADSSQTYGAEEALSALERADTVLTWVDRVSEPYLADPLQR